MKFQVEQEERQKMLQEFIRKQEEAAAAMTFSEQEQEPQHDVLQPEE